MRTADKMRTADQLLRRDLNERDLARDARELLEKIASAPRFAGSESEGRTRQLCAGILEGEGFSVKEDPFAFSEFPGRYGPTIIGLLLIVTAFLTAHMHAGHGAAGWAIVTLLAGLNVTGAAARWLGRRGTSRFPWLRSSSANLIATRGKPALWLVAHADSKSQTIPMLARIAAVLTTALALMVLGVSLAMDWLTVVGDTGGIVSQVVQYSALVAAAGSIPLVFCLTGNSSHGAVDNASGVVSVVLAVRELPRHGDLGVLVTSGEELALAGARAFVESTPARAIVVNCDTVDDRGGFLCMVTRQTRGEAAAGVSKAAARLGFPLRVRGVIPGILADSIAFSDAGWDAVTVSRGNLSTLARVHTSSDTREQLDGSGIAQAARLLAATIEELG
jgi:hypothetical protein